jgi:hypothetical protein
MQAMLGKQLFNFIQSNLRAVFKAVSQSIETNFKTIPKH